MRRSRRCPRRSRPADQREPLRCRAIDGDGRWRPIEVVANSLDDPPGMVVLSVRDRTGELGFEEMLADRSELYRQIVELIADGVWIIDEESRTTFASEPMAQMLGITPDEMLGRTIFEFMDGDGLAIAEANVERRKQGVTEAHPFKLRHREGHAVWTQMRTGPIATTGPYVGSVAVVADVTEQVDESRRHDRDRAHLRAMLDALPDVFFELGHDGAFLDASTTQVAQLLAPPEQLIGRTIHEVMAPGPAAVVAAAIRRTLARGRGPGLRPRAGASPPDRCSSTSGWPAADPTRWWRSCATPPSCGGPSRHGSSGRWNANGARTPNVGPSWSASSRPQPASRRWVACREGSPMTSTTCSG